MATAAVVKRKTVKTQAELAAFAGVSVRTIADWRTKPGFPVERDGTFSPWKICEWHTARLLAQSGKTLKPASGSQALELYRAEKALLTRQERLRRGGQLVPLALIRQVLMRLASVVRLCAARLRAEFGDEAMQILNEKINQFDSIVEEMLPEPTDESGDTEGSG